MEATITCTRCNRVLKDEKSKERGYGPVCFKIAEAEKSREEAEQMSAEGDNPQQE